MGIRMIPTTAMGATVAAITIKQATGKGMPRTAGSSSLFAASAL